LALPEVEESAHHGRPDLRVRGKIFATLPTESNSANVKITPENFHALLEREPGVFSKVWGDRWVGVDLDEISESGIAALLEDAWRLTAPKSLVRQLDEA
jgi:hypothetical protein